MKTHAIIVNADDLGISRGATLAVMRAHSEGVVTSASLTPTGADYPYAVEKIQKDCPALGVGLHFTLSAGRPVNPVYHVPSLVDERGFFCWEFPSLLRALSLGVMGKTKRAALLEQIALELEAQLDRLRTDGIRPDHINSERHVHLIPALFPIVAEAARRHGIPFLRAGNDSGWRWVRPWHYQPVLLQGGLLKFLLLQGLTRKNRSLAHGVHLTDHFASYLFTGRLDLVLDDILQHPPPGITEIMVHPGLPEHSYGVQLANPGVENYLMRQDRYQELAACLGARRLGLRCNLSTFAQLVDDKDELLLLR